MPDQPWLLPDDDNDRRTTPQFGDTPEAHLAHQYFQEFLQNGLDAHLDQFADTAEGQRAILLELLQQSRRVKPKGKLRTLLVQAVTQAMHELGNLSQALVQLSEETRKLSENQLSIVEQLTYLRHKPEDQPEPEERRFLIDAWNTYSGFRADMITRQNSVSSNVRTICKETLANQVGGDTVKNISRAMKHYWLPLNLWPPTRWPELAPSHPPLKATRRGALAVVATPPAIGLGRVLLDIASDGKLDGVIRMCHMLAPATHVAMIHAH